MKLALDPYMFRETPLLELPLSWPTLGYEWIELSPRDDFIPFFNHSARRRRPRAASPTPRSTPSVIASPGVVHEEQVLACLEAASPSSARSRSDGQRRRRCGW